MPNDLYSTALLSVFQFCENALNDKEKQEARQPLAFFLLSTLLKEIFRKSFLENDCYLEQIVYFFQL